MVNIHWIWIATWLVLVWILVISLFCQLFSRRRRSRTLRVCVVLSLLGHVLLAGYAATVTFAAAAPASGDSVVELSLGDEIEDSTSLEQRPPQFWEKFPTPTADATPDRISESLPDSIPQRMATPIADSPEVDDASSLLPIMTANVTAKAADLLTKAPSASSTPTKGNTYAPESIESHELEPLSDAANREITQTLPELNSSSSDVAAQDTSPKSNNLESPNGPPDVSHPSIRSAPAAAPPAAPVVQSSANQNKPAGDRHDGQQHNSEMNWRNVGDENPANQDDSDAADSRPVPRIYRLRNHPDRISLARRLGGNPDAEAAVQSALNWLAQAQSSDGGWDAARWGGGSEALTEGRDRRQAGSGADTAVTGLALLAFVGSGHTHQNGGQYQKAVRDGLAYLVNQQRRDGSIAGNAGLYAAMYCHSIALFALGETYAMTGDAWLRPAVQRAVNYSIAAQHLTSGGWRYRPGDIGDTSQLGWQVMALKSAELGGIQIPTRTQAGMNRFLSSVSSGRYGGLASYRTGQIPTAVMTAEALACRYFLGMTSGDLRATEAADYIVRRLPGDDTSHGSRMNLYYWYYATLALYHRQDEYWSRWNQALQRELIRTQRRSGAQIGSWDTNTVWGGSGGRVYTTAMATLCLEVYYRYLPTGRKSNDF